MTDEQRRHGHDINARAEPLFRELARVDDKIRFLRRQLDEVLAERKKLSSRLEILSEEKSAWYEEVLASTEA